MSRQRVRLRQHLDWRPEWYGAIEGWTVKFIKKNIWRCEAIHEFEDLIQDAYLTFLRITNTYPQVTEPQNFMALYKVALVNEMHDKSRVKQRCDLVMALGVEETFLAGRIGEITNEGYLFALIAEAPEELKLALMALANEETTAKLRDGAPKGRSAPRENLNMQLRRVLGIEGPVDIAGGLKKLLTA